MAFRGFGLIKLLLVFLLDTEAMISCRHIVIGIGIRRIRCNRLLELLQSGVVLALLLEPHTVNILSIRDHPAATRSQQSGGEDDENQPKRLLCETISGHGN